MSYTIVPSVSDGEPIVEDWGNSVVAAVTELQTATPETSETWAVTWSGVTVGSGSVFANYVQIGPLVYFQARFTFGAGSALAGDVSLTLPVAPKSNASSSVFGSGWAIDASPTTRYTVFAGNLSGSSLLIRPETVSATYTTVSGNTVGGLFTWATGDILAVTGTYLVA